MVSDLELVQKALDAKAAHDAMIVRIKAVLEFLRSNPPVEDPAEAEARQAVADALADIVATSDAVEPEAASPSAPAP